MPDQWLKDPDAVKDYQINWAARLAAGETITTSTWEVTTGLTKDSDTHTDSTTTVWLSGGTVGVTYTATNRIVTSDGRTDDQTLTFQIVEL